MFEKKKVALISGASRGIGRATALKFAREGYKISLCALNNIQLLEELKNELKMELNIKDNDILIFKCNLSNENEVKLWITKTIKKFGRVDSVVCNAGISKFNLLVNTSIDEWNEVIDINLKSTFLITKYIYDNMVENKSGSIVYVSSVWGCKGAAFESVYSTSKSALIGLAKSLAKELGPSNIRVNVIAPGAIDTDMMKDFDNEELNKFVSEIPLQRLGRVDEIANAIFFLGSENSNYITGSVLNIDGGIS